MELTVALERYDRHVPLFAGDVKPPSDLRLKPLEVGETTMKRDGMHRHQRMLRDLEFDVCEMSLASYIMGLSRDPEFPMIGVPVFPRRLFSMSQIYVNAAAGIDEPTDLVGRDVGIHAFQVTVSVLAKGDLKTVYGVPWRNIRWHCMRAENIPLEFPQGVSVQRIPEGADIGEMLVGGEIEALITPQPRPSMRNAGTRIRRLFQDPRKEEERYFETHGFYPIMHLLVMRRDTAARVPSLAGALVDLWEAAKNQAYEFYEDPNYSLLAWGANEAQRQREVLGADPWRSGIAANRADLKQFIGYCRDQGLIDRAMSVDELFDESVRDT